MIGPLQHQTQSTAKSENRESFNEKLKELGSMLKHWNQGERKSKRRLVEFQWSRIAGHTIKLSFRKTSVEHLPVQGVCVNCIWYEQRDRYFITSNDVASIIFSINGCPVVQDQRQEARKKLVRSLGKYTCISFRTFCPEAVSFFHEVKQFQNPKVYQKNTSKPALIPWESLRTCLREKSKDTIL